MATIQQVAEAFAARKPAKAGNAYTDGRTYYLHGHPIARHSDDGTEPATFDWCGWHTPTTANHLNHIIAALGIRRRVSWAQARDTKEGKFFA